MHPTAITQLTVPHIEAKRLRTEGDDVQIYDIARRKWVALTPEEWVRQCFVDWLINNKGYPLSRIANEIGLTVNKRSRRCDTVIMGKDGKPQMIVEYKAPSVNISQAVFNQIVRYNSILEAKYLVVSNGLKHYCCEIDYANHSYRFLPDIPVHSKE